MQILWLWEILLKNIMDYVEILSTKFMVKTMLEYYDFLEII
jgi:hypothetical protein